MNVTVASTLSCARSMTSQMRRKAGSPSIKRPPDCPRVLGNNLYRQTERSQIHMLHGWAAVCGSKRRVEASCEGVAADDMRRTSPPRWHRHARLTSLATTPSAVGGLTPRLFNSARTLVGRSVRQAHARRCDKCQATRWSSVTHTCRHAIRLVPRRVDLAHGAPVPQLPDPLRWSNTRDQLQGRLREKVADLVSCISLLSGLLLLQPSDPGQAHCPRRSTGRAGSRASRRHPDASLGPDHAGTTVALQGGHHC